MFNNKKIFFIIPVFLILLGSSPVFLPETEESYFPASEMIVVEESLDILNLEIGYDRGIKLHYIIYSDGYSEEGFDIKKHQLIKILQNRDIILLKSIYEKIYNLYTMTKYEMNNLKTLDIEKYEQIKAGYVPPLKKYMDLLEAHIYSRDPTLKGVLTEKRKKISNDVTRHYKKLEKGGNTFFTKEEISILHKTTQALDYDYGYDKEIELAYIFSFSYSEKNISQKERDFSEIIGKLDRDSLVNFHNKIYKLFTMTMYKVDIYKERKDWKYYIYIKNELFPPLKKYFHLLERNVNLKDPSLKSVIEKNKKETEKWVKWYYRDKEGIVDIF